MTTPATSVDPNVPAVDPSAPPVDPVAPSTPPAATVPLATHVGERRQWQGKVSSLTARIQELEGAQAPKAPMNATEEDKVREQWLDRLGIKNHATELADLKKELTEVKAKAARGEAAANSQMARDERAMTKASKHVTEALDKDLTGLGFTAETWESFVASQMTDDDVEEIFASPSHAKAVAKRCRDMMMPKINLQKSQAAVRVLNLPITPGAGGTPPAPPENQPLKVGKALHSRAFERLQGRVAAEGS